MQVKDSMQTQVTTVTLETLVSIASQTMHGKKIRHLPVVTGQNTLVGVLTDRDVRRAEASDAPHMAEHELTYLLDKLRVQDIMTRDVVTVSSITPIEEAGQIFLQKKFGCLPVVRDNNTLRGIITLTDLLRAYVARHDRAFTRLSGAAPPREGSSVPVSALMHQQLITTKPNMSLADVQRLMHDSHIRHVPVLSKNRLVGLITDRDMRDAFPSPATTLARGEIAYQMATTPVKHCMTKNVAWIGPEMDVVQATRLLLQQRFGCLPVLDNGILVGIITEMDCLRGFLDTVEGAQE
jgi:CBS domain-containing protein